MSVQSGQRITPARINKRAIRFRRTVTQLLGSGSFVPIQWDAEDFDNTLIGFPPTTSIALPGVGLWGFAGYAGVQSNANGNRRLLLEIGSSGVYPTIDQRQAVNGDATHMTISGTHVSTGGDVLRLNVQQNSGINLNLLADATFSVWLIES